MGERPGRAGRVSTDTVFMTDFVSLDLDPDFRRFNFCALRDPSLGPGGGPDESDLFRMAYLAQRGDKSAAAEFADTLCWTLREETFEAFQRAHGPRPLRFAHWFYAKLGQLLGILLHTEILVYGLGLHGSAGKPETEQPWREGSGVLTGRDPAIDGEELGRAFLPEDAAQFDWAGLVRTLLAAGERRLAAFEELLRERIRQAEARRAGTFLGSMRRRSRNEERDMIVASCLARGEPRHEICRILDQKGIPTTPMMRQHEVTRWTDAWSDPEFRNNVQQVFSKVKRRR
jgi:hypothetical protein